MVGDLDSGFYERRGGRVDDQVQTLLFGDLLEQLLHARAGFANGIVAVGFEIGRQVVVQALELGLFALAASLEIGFAGLAQLALAGLELGLNIGQLLLALLEGVLPRLEFEPGGP